MHYVSGRLALETLLRENRYVFHGTPNGTINVFEPQTVVSRAADKNGPILFDTKMIFATKQLDVAIFSAVVFHSGRSGWYTKTNDVKAGFTFHADADVAQKAHTAAGYVYMFPQKLFKKSPYGEQEYVSYESCTPLYCVRVTAEDVRPDIDTLQSDPDPAH